jgi:small-conductance mechanosensitive channel
MFRSMVEGVGQSAGRALGLEHQAVHVMGKLLAILAVIGLTLIAYRVVTGLIRRLLRPLTEGQVDPVRAQRARTLGPLLISVTRYLFVFIVIVVILQEVGIDVRALVVSAGVLGLAVGFGAQSLIKDVITGAFLFIEGLVAVGDVIEVGSHTGVVESVGLRVTKLRKFSGELRIIPNGELTAFGHHSAGWSRVVVEVGIAPDQDLDRAIRALESAGRELRAAYPGVVLEPFTAQGILRFGDSEMVLRVHARAEAMQRFDLELDLRRRVKVALEAAGIALPYRQRIVRLTTDSAKEPPA